jgi:glyoxylase-like metal-dependent hydrolase (beta-lactamase superfamily II)
MDVPPVEGCPDTYLVDNEMFGMEEALASYVLDAERPALLDAGTETSADRILDAMTEVGVDTDDVAYVFVSHVHLDHAAGADRLLDACPNATAVVHERGLPYLTDPEKLDRLLASVSAAIGFEDPYGSPDPLPRERCAAVSGGETFDLGDRVLEITDAPGHAPHHYVALDPDSRMLFSADAVGAFHPEEKRVAPSTPPPSFDLEANLETIDRLRELDPSRLLFTHFGPGEDAMAELDAYERVLPQWIDDVAAARERVGDDIDDLVAELEGDWEMYTLERDVAGALGYLDRREE